jgi:diguanylate cyclase (GGDEF)-like protein
VLTVVGAAVMVIWYLVVGPSLFRAGDAPAAARLFVVVLPVTDAVLLLTVVTVLMHGTVTSARPSLLLLLTGHAGNLIGDLWLTYLVVFRSGGDLPRTQILATLLSLGLLAAAAIERCRRTDERRAGAQQRLRASTTFPCLAVAGGYALLVVAAAKSAVYPWAGLVGGALIMTTGVAGRQLVSLRENHRLVVTDSLTGLANRLLFTEQLTRGLERVETLSRSRPPGPSALAVLHIDLDGFKEINDTHGHDAGDRVLATFATLLTDAVRRSDTPARIGGDEFGVVLLDLSGPQEAIDVARRLLDVASRNPVVLGGEHRRIRCSVGVAYHDPRDPTPIDPETLLDQADQARYLAKRDGRTGWALWNERVADEVIPPQRRPSGTAVRNDTTVY